MFALSSCGGSENSTTKNFEPQPIPSNLQDAVLGEYDLSIGDSVIFSLPNAQSISLTQGTLGHLYALDDIKNFEETQNSNVEVVVSEANDETTITSKSGKYRYEVNPFLLKLPYEAKFKIIVNLGNEKISSLTIDFKEPFLQKEWYVFNKSENFMNFPIEPVANVDGNIYEAWKLKDKDGNHISGKGVLVGIIDSEVDFKHEDLQEKVVAPRISHPYVNMEVKERGGSLPSHGTQVSGIIAANHNDIGLTGIAYDAKLISMSESIVPQDGKSTDLLKFVADIVEENPQIKVLNASISTDILMQGDDKTKPFEKIYLNNTSLTHSLGNELKPQKFMNYLL